MCMSFAPRRIIVDFSFKGRLIAADGNMNIKLHHTSATMGLGQNIGILGETFIPSHVISHVREDLPLLLQSH